MPFAFAIIGLVLVVAGVRGSSADLLKLFAGDFTGDNNFIYWALSVAIIGGLGYIDELRPISRAFLVLIIVVLILAEDKNAQAGGFFTKFQDAVAEITGTAGGA
jgi:hypothetical protein